MVLNCQAADLELLNGQVDAAFARFLELVRGTSDDEREQAKQHLLELLDLVGNDVPEVLAARTTSWRARSSRPIPRRS